VLTALTGGAVVEREGEDGLVVPMVRERVPEALRALASAGVSVYGVADRASSLEEVFLEVTGGETV
jgi:hypothetical protein